ncbi:MAG: hypothetical protein SOZ63_01240, partial [Eggerthellaceae bacterium]|nr:hypothetical protein [Eggerthellaceae bacterium]
AKNGRRPARHALTGRPDRPDSASHPEAPRTQGTTEGHQPAPNPGKPRAFPNRGALFRIRISARQRNSHVITVVQPFGGTARNSYINEAA